jgi:hypothetical protein
MFAIDKGGVDVGCGRIDMTLRPIDAFGHGCLLKIESRVQIRKQRSLPETGGVVEVIMCYLQSPGRTNGGDA